MSLLAFSPLGPVENVLTALLEWLHATIGLPWGISIVVLTLMVRFVMVPLTVKQIHSMQKLQAVAPELKALQQKYKHDKQRQQQEVMAFYKENKVNPMASCLPLIVQIPIFIGLFYVLRGFEQEVYRPRYPDSDLSFLGIVPSITENVISHWSGYLLVFLYVTSQVGSTLLTPIADRTQRMIFLALPFVFVFFVIHFPAGLMLYWVTTNLWTMGQGLITRRFIPRPQPPPKRTSRAEPREPTRDAAGDADADGTRPKTAAKSGSGSGQRRVRRRKKRGPQARR